MKDFHDHTEKGVTVEDARKRRSCKRFKASRPLQKTQEAAPDLLYLLTLPTQQLLKFIIYATAPGVFPRDSLEGAMPSVLGV